MTRGEWIDTLDQALAYGIRDVQFVGGEPTLHPDFPALVDHALTIGLRVEVFSNLVHVSDECWEVFRREGLSLATSYYSDRAHEHDAVTRRRSHHRTRANIATARRLDIPVRVGVIVTDDHHDTDAARRDLASLGVAGIRVDHVRPFGRGARGRAPDAANLCGRCGDGRAAVGPTGEVSPCVFSTWMGVGNVRNTSLASILGGPAMQVANASIRARSGGDDDGDDECTPGFPGSECTPRN